MNVFDRILEIARQGNPEYFHKMDVGNERYYRMVRWIMFPFMTILMFAGIGMVQESWNDGDLKNTLVGLFVTAFSIIALIFLRVSRKRRLKRLAEWESAQKEDGDREKNNTPSN